MAASDTAAARMGTSPPISPLSYRPAQGGPQLLSALRHKQTNLSSKCMETGLVSAFRPTRDRSDTARGKTGPAWLSLPPILLKREVHVTRLRMDHRKQHVQDQRP